LADDFFGGCYMALEFKCKLQSLLRVLCQLLFLSNDVWLLNMDIVVVALCVYVWSKRWSSNVDQACMEPKITILHFVYNACSVLLQLDVMFHWWQISFFVLSLHTLVLFFVEWNRNHVLQIVEINGVVTEDCTAVVCTSVTITVPVVNIGSKSRFQSDFIPYFRPVNYRVFNCTACAKNLGLL